MTSRGPVVSRALLQALKQDSRLPPGVWYFTTAVTLSALNRPGDIAAVLHSALEQAQDPPCVSGGTAAALGHDGGAQMRIARRMREGLVKSAAVVGLPKTINALLELKRHTPEHLLDPPMAASPTGRAIELSSLEMSTLLHRGESYFSRVYGKIAARVMGQMDRSGTEDLGLIARLMYGYILSNTSVLSAMDSSFVLIAGLIPQDVNPQLKGHLKGAVNNGATVDQVRAVRDAVISICQAGGMARVSDSERAAWGWREDVANL